MDFDTWYQALPKTPTMREVWAAAQREAEQARHQQAFTISVERKQHAPRINVTVEEARILGVTATPERSDRKTRSFDEWSVEYSGGEPCVKYIKATPDPRTGHQIIEQALREAAQGNWLQAPFGLDPIEGRAYQQGKAAAYRHALEMIHEPEVALTEAACAYRKARLGSNQKAQMQAWEALWRAAAAP